MMTRLLVAMVLGFAVAAVLRALRGPRGLFEVRVTRQGRARVRGPVPGRTREEVARFVGGLGLPPGARFIAVPEGASFRLRFTKSVPPQARAQIQGFIFQRGEEDPPLRLLH